MCIDLSYKCFHFVSLFALRVTSIRFVCRIKRAYISISSAFGNFLRISCMVFTKAMPQPG